MFTVSWNRVTTSFLALGPSRIKHLLRSGEKLALNLTTYLHSSTNSFKCAKLYDCYEYGLESSSQSLTNMQRFNVENLFARFFCQRIISHEKKQDVQLYMQGAIIFLCENSIMFTLFLLTNKTILKSFFICNLSVNIFTHKPESNCEV